MGERDVLEGIASLRREPGEAPALDLDRRNWRLGRLIGGRVLDEQRGQQIDKGGYQHRIEGPPSLVPQHSDRTLLIEGPMVRALGRHRVVVVDDGENARADRNLCTGE